MGDGYMVPCHVCQSLVIAMKIGPEALIPISFLWGAEHTGRSVKELKGQWKYHRGFCHNTNSQTVAVSRVPEAKECETMHFIDGHFDSCEEDKQDEGNDECTGFNSEDEGCDPKGDKDKKDEEVANSCKKDFDQQAQVDLNSSIIGCKKERESLTQNICKPSNKYLQEGGGKVDDKVTKKLSQITDAVSIFAACSKMSNTLLIAQSAVAAYKTACTAGIASCENTCQEAQRRVVGKEDFCTKVPSVTASCTAAQINKINEEDGWFCKEKNKIAFLETKKEEIEENSKVCVSQNLTLDKVLESGVGLARSIAIAQVCKAQTKSDDVAKLDESVNCEDPANASKMTCICAVNPRDPICAGSFKATTPGGGFGDTGVGKGVGAGNSEISSKIDKDMKNFGSDSLGGPSGLDNMAANRGGGKGSPSKSLQRRGGSGAPGGGSGGAPGYGSSASSSGGRSGLSSGGKGPGSGFYGSRRSGGEGNSSPYGYRQGTTTGGAYGKRSRFNLKKYLPGGKIMRRRIAGIVGRDGITGPNGMGLFRKVSYRIKKQRNGLLP